MTARHGALAGTSTELQRIFKPRASFASGVSRHAARMYFGFNITFFFSFEFGDMAEIQAFCNICKKLKPERLLF
jgi:hypothetical protein